MTRILNSVNLPMRRKIYGSGSVEKHASGNDYRQHRTRLKEKPSLGTLMNTATEKLLEALKKKTVTAKQIQELLAAGAEVNERQDQDCMSPLQVAIDSGASLSTIRALIEAGADVDACLGWDDLGDGDQDDPPYDAMHAPLQRAAMRTDDEAPAIVTALCEAGADPNLPSDDQGTVALHYACTCGVVEALILHGADVDAGDNFGCTPLLGFLRGDTEADFGCLKALIHVGADPSLRESDNKTNAFDYIASVIPK